MEEFISTQDDLILRACGHELETIGSMEYEQGTDICLPFSFPNSD